MTWPTTAISTANVDAGADSPALAREQIKESFDALNLLMANGIPTLKQDLSSAAEGKGSALVTYNPALVGAVARTLQDKLQDTLNVEDFGADGTQSGDSLALKAALAAAEPMGVPVILPARRFFWDGSTINENKVRIWGSGMPAVNSTKTSLDGGTIIQGKMHFTGDFVDLRDFGVDTGSDSGLPASDALKCLASPYNSGKHLHTENIIGLCNSPASAFHALLFEGYAQHTGANIHGVNGYFGVVLKNRNIRVTSIKATDPSDTGVYFKSDNVYGQCSNVQVETIEVVGTTPGAVDYAVRLQADSALMDNVQIGRIRAQGHGSSLLVQTLNATGASFGSARIDSIISEGATTDDVFIYNLRPGGSLNHLSIGSIVTTNPASKVLTLLCEPGATIGAVHVDVIHANYALGTSQAVLDGAVFIGGGVQRTDFRSVALIVDNSDSVLGAVNYSSSGGKHLLGARVARVTGPGKPSPGYSSQALSGNSATLVVPRNEAGTRSSFVKLTHTSPITITSFVQPTTGDSAFEIGHILTVFNATSNLVTVNTNGPGNILNSGYTNVTINENNVRAWVLGDDNVWRGLP